MSARDDYPIGRTETAVTYWIDPGMWKDMCDEIDQLRAEVEQLRGSQRRYLSEQDCTDSPVPR